MLCVEGRVALAAFISFAVLSLYQVRILCADYWSYEYCLLVFITAVSCTFALPYSGIVKRAGFLGTIFGGALVLIYFTVFPWKLLCVFLVALSFFHFSEYLLTAIYNEHTLNLSSFLINHSVEYQLAVVLSVSEFVVETLLLPSLKHFFLINFVGFILVLGGELLRKVSMVTAKSNFTHIVQDEKKESHILVTSGVYAWSRHPSYVGWFYWSIGTQIMLCNPICTVLYCYASWKFFYDRIRDEEFYLFKFFGKDYIDYVEKVPTRIPFANGLYDELKPFMAKSKETHK
ncbi:protein-S-isoprenylcysteine O-methyltransferase isoform X1 [Hydra vulgaris]|uniref:protein-S-isoprenylcysteine O-methyltransferase isoform X1 n=1 Tax=Hydra vulgaris TaxID=6087 RepID=UPI001F5F483A|nr:protein-S-isoprenylcysteine O-methyltransferase [Hydra vulgaris]